MNQLISSIRANIAAEDKRVALSECHKGWDGGIDIDAIVQGVMERYAAMGKPIQGGVKVARKDLTTIRIEDKCGPLLTFMLCVHNPNHHSVTAFKYGERWLTVVRRAENFFHDHELEEMGKWLLENFHH